jgi:hypothetical protein
VLFIYLLEFVYLHSVNGKYTGREGTRSKLATNNPLPCQQHVNLSTSLYKLGAEQQRKVISTLSIRIIMCSTFGTITTENTKAKPNNHQRILCGTIERVSVGGETYSWKLGDQTGQKTTVPNTKHMYGPDQTTQKIAY